MADHSDTREHGLREFLTWAVEKSELPSRTVEGYRVAANKILPLADGYPDIDLRTLDVEATLVRFVNKYRMEYKDASLETYKSRFRHVVAMFLARVDGDPDWRTAGRPLAKASATPRTKRAPRTSTPKRVESAEQGEQDAHDALQRPPSPPPNGGFDVAVPIRGGRFIVQMRLPLDLTPDDARRVAGVVQAYAGPLEPADPSSGGGA